MENLDQRVPGQGRLTLPRLASPPLALLHLASPHLDVNSPAQTYMGEVRPMSDRGHVLSSRSGLAKIADQ